MINNDVDGDDDDDDDIMNSDHDSSLSLPPGLGFYSIISTHFQRSSS